MRTKNPPTEPSTFEVSSGNVFADLGMPDPDIVRAKAHMVIRMEETIAARGLSDAKAAKLLGLTKEKMLLMFRNEYGEYSIDCLCQYLNKLGVQVDIVLRTDRGNSDGATTRAFAAIPVTPSPKTGPRR